MIPVVTGVVVPHHAAHPISFHKNKIDRTFPYVLEGQISHQRWTAFCDRVDEALAIDSKSGVSRASLNISLVAIGIFFLIIQILFYTRTFETPNPLVGVVPMFILIYLFIVGVVLWVQRSGSRGEVQTVVSNRKLSTIAFVLTGIFAFIMQVLFYTDFFLPVNGFSFYLHYLDDYNGYYAMYWAFMRVPGIVLMYLAVLLFSICLSKCCCKTIKPERTHLVQVYHEMIIEQPQVNLFYDPTNPTSLQVEVAGNRNMVHYNGCEMNNNDLRSVQARFIDLEAAREFLTEQEYKDKRSEILKSL